jgi:hypothetical protein
MLVKRLTLLVFLTMFILLEACQPPAGDALLENRHTGDEASHSAAATTLPGWNIYHNEKFAFTLDVPPGWQVMETPNRDYPTESEQVWFSAEDFPSFAQHKLPDVLIAIWSESPATRWEPQYFDEYEVRLLAGELPVEGTYITGLNKETGRRDEVVIARLPSSVFLELQRTGVEDMSEIFNQMVRTLRPVE